MRTYILIIASLFVLASCSTQEDAADAYGNFETDKRIISAEGNGKLLNFQVEEGDFLKEGQIIGQIDTLNLHLQKLQLLSGIQALRTNFSNIQAQVEVNEQQKANLDKDLTRVVNLLKEGAATRKQLDDLEGKKLLLDKQIVAIQSQRQNISAQIATNEQQLAQLDLAIARCTIINPVDGKVLNTMAKSFEMTGQGKPLYAISDTRQLKLKAYISGAQLPHIKLGQEVDVLVDNDEKSNTTLKGKVVWISENSEFTPKIIQTKEERVALVYAVKVLVENDGSLKIGMPGEINFMREE